MRVRIRARGGRTAKDARPRNNAEVTTETAPKATPRPLYAGECPVCDGADKLKVTTYTDQLGRERWSVHCRSVNCDPPGGAWLREAADVVGAPGGGAILENPLHWLRDYIGSADTDREPEPLPSEGSVAQCAKFLFATPDALAYLTDERGLTADTLRREQIGWNGSAFTFPIYEADGELVNWIRRPWPAAANGRRYVVLGRTAELGAVELYPRPLPSRNILVVEGLLDALLLRQHGLPAVTSTHGVNSFSDEWLPLMSGRTVAVAYDVGVEQVQRHRVEQLRAAGADAFGVSLSRLDLPDKGDLPDYLQSGGTIEELRAFINAEYRRARR